ncbi:MAG: flagellar brake protein [Armatimonadota bacterium]
MLALIGSLTIVFLVGYLLAKAFGRKSVLDARQRRTPVDNARVRFKTSSAVYRSRLISHDDKQWVFAAPMQRDSYIPVPVGEECVCEVVARGGVLLFTSKVIARQSQEGRIVIEAPVNPKLRNRRDDARRIDIPMTLLVGNHGGEVLDLSTNGAKVKLSGFQKEGQTVRVDLPDGESRAGTVIESTHDSIGSTVRISFDRPIHLPD